MENLNISSGSPEGQNLEKQSKGNLTMSFVYVFIELCLNLRETELALSFTSFLDRWGIFLTNVS